MRQLRHLHDIVLAVLALMVAACGGSGDSGSANPPPTPPPPPPPPAVASIVVSPPSATLAIGRTVTFTAVARDAGGNPIAGTVFTWSTSDANVASIAANGVATAITAGTVSVQAAAGTVTSSTAALRVQATPASTATSDDLIAAALAAGTIDAETALVYRAYAQFGDARLPAQYRGAPSSAFESTLLDDVLAVFDTLSADAQNKLAPFLLRPASVGSWLDANRPQTVQVQRQARVAGTARVQLRPDCLGVMSHWAATAPGTAPVRVWYDTAEAGHAGFAANVALQIETAVWPTLITRLGYKPPLDDQSLLGCDGGDAKLDIYIVRAGSMEDLGRTVPESSPGYDRNRSAVHVRIQAGLDQEVLNQTVAHEVAHALHWAYPTAASQPSYGWFRDAFANWAALQVYPQNQSVLNGGSCVLDTPEKPIDDAGKMQCSQVGKPISRAYGAWLPLEAISWKEGAGAIQRVLEATASVSTAFEAMDSVLGARLRGDWARYALALWNQDPIDQRPDSFFQRQNLIDKPKLAPDQPNPVVADLGGKTYDETLLDARVNNMSVKFYQFTFTDVATRSVMIHNTWRENRRKGDKVSVHALWKPEGKPWVEEDLTDYEWIGFCRDKKDERLEQLVLVVSSAEWRGGNPVVVADKAPRVMRNNIGCWGFAGTTKRVYAEKNWTAGSTVTTFTARYDYNPGGTSMHITDAGLARLRVPVAGPLFSGGELSFTEGYSEGKCSYSASLNSSETTILLGGESFGSIVLNNFVEALPPDVYASQTGLTGTADGAYLANGATNRLLTGQVRGEGCPPTYQTMVAGWLLTRTSAASSQKVAADGHLRGTYTASTPAGSYTEDYEWDLAPLREP